MATGVVHMLGHSLGIEHDMTGWLVAVQLNLFSRIGLAAYGCF